MALIFVGLPYVVRTAAAGLARPCRSRGRRRPRQHPWRPSRAQVAIRRRSCSASLGPSHPHRRFGLAFARAVGEYGSVIFIAGNQPLRSEIAPLLVVIRLQEFDYASAAALGFVMLAISLTCLGVVMLLRRHLSRGIA